MRESSPSSLFGKHPHDIYIAVMRQNMQSVPEYQTAMDNLWCVQDACVLDPRVSMTLLNLCPCSRSFSSLRIRFLYWFGTGHLGLRALALSVVLLRHTD